MSDCIFCKIANGDIPSATVYEDDDFRAILDIAPANKGHVIILPKKHYDNLLVADADILSKALLVAQKVGNAQKKALGADGVNVLQNNGTDAWQSVFHLHIHVIPRFKDDKILFPWRTLSYADGEAEEIAAKMRSCMK